MESPAFDKTTWRDGLIAVVLALVVAFGLHALTSPHELGTVNDDSMYAVSARALASGLGYVDTSHAERPTAGRFPIGYPLMLAASSWGAAGSEAMLARMLWVAPIAAGLFVAMAYGYLRRGMGWPWGLALGVAGAIALHPGMAGNASILLSDLPFAAVAFAGLMGLERLLRAGAKPPVWAWVAGGAVIGAACLVRYAGAALLVAAAFTLLRERRFGPLFAVGGGFALVFLPWLLHQLAAGSEEYGGVLAFTLAQGFDAVIAAFGQSSTLLLSVALPGLLSPGIFTFPNLASFLVGTAVSAVVLVGAIDGLWRPGPGRTALAPLYLLLTVALTVVWSAGFLELGHGLHTRLLLPVAPLVFVAFLQGLRLITPHVPALASRWVASAAIVATLLTSGAHHVVAMNASERAASEARAEHHEQALFTAIRQVTPPTARLLSLHATTVHWFTDRICYGMLFGGHTDALARQIVARRIDYVVGMPFLMPEPRPIPGAKLPPTPFRPVDFSVAVLNELLLAYPDLLEPVYIGGEGSYVIFRVRPEAVARLRQQAGLPG